MDGRTDGWMEIHCTHYTRHIIVCDPLSLILHGRKLAAFENVGKRSVRLAEKATEQSGTKLPFSHFGGFCKPD